MEYGTRPALPPSSVPDSDDALLKMTISQQEFGRPGLPDLSSMTEEEQIAYAMQMSLQGAGESPGGQTGHMGWVARGTEQTDLPSSEFGQAESADIDASSAMDTSEPAKVRASMTPCPPCSDLCPWAWDRPSPQAQETRSEEQKEASTPTCIPRCKLCKGSWEACPGVLRLSFLAGWEPPGQFCRISCSQESD